MGGYARRVDGGSGSSLISSRVLISLLSSASSKVSNSVIVTPGAAQTIHPGSGLISVGSSESLTPRNLASSTPSDDSCRCNEQAREIGGEALRRVEAEQGRLDDRKRAKSG